jgi:hypothetical protein
MILKHRWCCTNLLDSVEHICSINRIHANFLYFYFYFFTFNTFIFWVICYFPKWGLSWTGWPIFEKDLIIREMSGMSIRLTSVLQTRAHPYSKHSPLPLISCPVQFKPTLSTQHSSWLLLSVECLNQHSTVVMMNLMWYKHRVVHGQSTDVSEEHIGSIFNVEK